MSNTQSKIQFQLKNMSLPSVAMSSRTYPIRSVQPGSGLNLTELRLRVASGSQEDPVHHRRADEEAPREPEVVAPRPEPGALGIPLTTEALAARGDSLEHLRRCVAVSFSRSACPTSSSTIVEEQDDLKKQMDEYMLHKDYHQSIGGEDGEEPIEAIGSLPQTDMVSYYYSGLPANLANTASLPRRSTGIPWPTFTTPPCEEPTWRPELPTTTRTPEAYPAYVEGSHTLGPAYGALDHTAELLAKVSFASEDPDVTALSKAIRAELGISELLLKPAIASPSPGLTSLADDLKRARVSRLLLKVTCPSPFYPRARIVPIAELQDVPVTEAEKRELTALAPLAGKLPPHSHPTSGGG